MHLIATGLDVAAVDVLGHGHVLLGNRVLLLVREMRDDSSFFVDCFFVCLQLLWHLVCAHPLDLSLVLVQEFGHLEGLVDIVGKRHCELRKLEVMLVVHRASMYDQELFKQEGSIAVLREHLADSVVDDFLRVLLEHSLHRDLVELARVASVVTVHHLEAFTPGHLCVGSVDNDTYISLVVSVGHIARFMGAPDEFRNQGGHPSQWEAGCVKKVHCPAVFVRLGDIRALGLVHRVPRYFANSTVD